MGVDEVPLVYGQCGETGSVACRDGPQPRNFCDPQHNAAVGQAAGAPTPAPNGLVASVRTELSGLTGF